MTRGKPLKRSTPLRAKRWGIATKPPRRLSRPGSDPAYLRWIRTLPCCVAEMEGAGPCEGRMEANHAGRKPGMGLKCSDHETLAKCSRHHRMWTDHAGVFAGWTKEERRAWADVEILWTWRQWTRGGGKVAA